MLDARYHWVIRTLPELDPDDLAAGSRHELSARVTAVLAARGVRGSDLDAFFGPAEAGLDDPNQLPDGERLVERLERARRAGETVLVFGDFDADGLTGLAILSRTFRRLGIEARPYVPSRLDEGHGLSLAAIDTAVGEGIGLIVTVDCGSTSRAEIDVANARGVDVIVTDHHRVPADPPAAIALVNPQRADAAGPGRNLSGAGVAFSVARLLFERIGPGTSHALDLADLAIIGTVADVAPLVGENRAIARLGLERLRTDPRPGLAALLARAGSARGPVDADTIAFALAPRLNAAGRMGASDVAAQLLLTDDPAEAAELAEALEAANRARRDLTREAIDAARLASPADDAPAVVVRGPWPVGIVGLVAARLSDDRGRPAVVGAELGATIRASLRGDGGLDLGAALEHLADLFERSGGHRGAAGFEIAAERWPAFEARFLELAAASQPVDPRPTLTIDLAVPAASVDYALHRDLGRLAPTGPGNPYPLVAVLGASVVRVRAAQGGHTQFVLKRDRDVLDAIAFDRPDLAERVVEGDRLDVVARLTSRSFAGLETLQLEIRDAATAGTAPEFATAGEAVAPLAVAG